jgi:hypothetical protein
MTDQYEEISPERARQLLDLYVSPEEWQEATDFMRKMYGDQAYELTVTVDLGEEYDDEHEYYTSGEVTCVDCNGMILEMDTTYCQRITQTLRSEQNLSVMQRLMTTSFGKQSSLMRSPCFQ